MNQAHNSRFEEALPPDRNVGSSRVRAMRRWSRSLLPLLAMMILVAPALAACGGGDDDDERTGRVVWYQGVPPSSDAPPVTEEQPEVAQNPAETPAQEAPAPTATTESVAPTATTATEQAQADPPGPTGKLLTAEELDLYQPNELGNVAVLMYHNIVQEYGPGEEGDVLFRTEAEFRADLQWLYDNDFYVIPFYDYVTNQIKAPAGKKPFVLTFDDSRPNQFNYLIADDGSVTIDPHSAVGIMEDFFASHPDFGHTAFFAMLPIWCFDYEAPDQTQYCEQKLTWLYENGYEVGNHTWDHQDLYDQSNEVFREKVVNTSRWVEERVPEGNASRILILPYGNFPNGEHAEEQWDWIRHGIPTDDGPFQLTSVVAAGANPANSPSHIDFDVMSIARIGAKDYPSDGEADLFLNYWFGVFDSSPESLYVSDGNPDTVTFPSWNAGNLDAEKATAEGKQVIEY